MSPISRETRLIVEAEGLRGGRKEVKIEPSKTDQTITVTWITGDVRVFDVQALRRIIEVLGYQDKLPEMWFEASGRSGGTFHCHIAEDGRLTASCTPTPQGWVSWEDLKRALQASIAELA